MLQQAKARKALLEPSSVVGKVLLVGIAAVDEGLGLVLANDQAIAISELGEEVLELHSLGHAGDDERLKEAVCRRIPNPAAGPPARTILWCGPRSCGPCRRAACGGRRPCRPSC